MFDLLQSRLKASGLMPADEPEIVPIDESSYPSLGQGLDSGGRKPAATDHGGQFGVVGISSGGTGH